MIEGLTCSEQFTVLEQRDDWTKIRTTKGTEGYVSSLFVGEAAEVQRSAATTRTSGPQAGLKTSADPCAAGLARIQTSYGSYCGPCPPGQSLVKSAVGDSYCSPATTSQQAAQSNGNTLTNPDVTRMLKAGVSDETIILAIQQSATKFDTSPDALIKLKEQGASEKLLQSILTHNSQTSGTTARETAPENHNGALTGKILAVTRGGDLKPGRFAKVYLGNLANAGYTAEADARSLLDLAAQRDKTYRAWESSAVNNPFTPLFRGKAEQACINDVLSATPTASSQVATADENGQFTVSDLSPGRYFLVAIGRAGTYAAVWAETLSIESEKTTTFTPAGPRLSCLDGNRLPF